MPYGLYTITHALRHEKEEQRHADCSKLYNQVRRMFVQWSFIPEAESISGRAPNGAQTDIRPILSLS